MSKEMMSDAGVPMHMMAEAEAKGLDFVALWKAIQDIQAIISDKNRSTWQMVMAIIGVVITLIPTQTKPDDGPVKV